MGNKTNIILISSSGGHFEQLSRLKILSQNYNITIIVEKTEYKADADYYLRQIDKKQIFFIFNFIFNLLKSFYLFIKIKPQFLISTGAMTCIPMFIIGKIFRRKLIFIESFARVKSPSKTGRFIYKFADLFIIQWEELIEFYPKAILGGSIY